MRHLDVHRKASRHTLLAPSVIAALGAGLRAHEATLRVPPPPVGPRVSPAWISLLHASPMLWASRSPRRFEKATEREQHLALPGGGTALVLGGGHAFFKPADRVIPGRGQRALQFLTNGTELFRADQRGASNRVQSRFCGRADRLCRVGGRVRGGTLALTAQHLDSAPILDSDLAS